MVALRKESVDRNVLGYMVARANCTSLSARRAWIEIAQGVGDAITTASLSARRAWIEIYYPGTGRSTNRVALRKESVDRNPAVFNILKR